ERHEHDGPVRPFLPIRWAAPLDDHQLLPGVCPDRDDERRPDRELLAELVGHSRRPRRYDDPVPPRLVAASAAPVAPANGRRGDARPPGGELRTARGRSWLRGRGRWERVTRPATRRAARTAPRCHWRGDLRRGSPSARRRRTAWASGSG